MSLCISAIIVAKQMKRVSFALVINKYDLSFPLSINFFLFCNDKFPYCLEIVFSRVAWLKLLEVFVLPTRVSAGLNAP